MKLLTFICFFVVGNLAFATTIDLTNFKNIKEVSVEASSQALLTKASIQEPLEMRDLDHLSVHIEVGNTKDKYRLSATILPAEENCNCQSVFQIEIPILELSGIYVVDHTRVEIIEIEHE